jgi:hypothetical protein
MFNRWFGTTIFLPGRLWLIVYELYVRSFSPVLLAPLFVLPGIGPQIREWFVRRMWCAFLGFPDGDGARPGCLLHPSRWAGRDVRPRVAFAPLPGVWCGEPGHSCRAADVYRSVGMTSRRQFRERTRRLDWFDYSRAVEGAEAELLAGPTAVPRTG